MSIETTTRSFGTAENHYDNFVEQGIDCDITLPDYCPDIMRILKCTVEANLTNTKLTGDRATADGTALIKIIYADEKNNIFCYEHEYPFSKFAELSGTFDGAVLSACVKTEYINCRAVSKRRLDIHGIISIHFCVDSVKKETVISNAVGDGVQLKKKSIDITSAVATANKTIQFSQVEQVKDNKPNVGKILFSSATPVLAEVKVIKGKALLKGELIIKAVYAADSAENTAVTVDYSLPFNEIAEIDGLTDECGISTKMCITQLKVEPKEDNDGDYRFISINAEIQACINVTKTENITIISDSYSTDVVIDTDYKTQEFTDTVKRINDTFSSKNSIDISSLNPEKLYMTTVGAIQTKTSFSNGQICIKGKIPVGFIVYDSNGSPAYCERENEFEYTTSVDGNNLYCQPQVAVTGYSCNLSGDGKADFKAELKISGEITSTRKEKILTDIDVDGNAEPIKKHSSLTVYFCSGNENVWDIARHYNTTVEDIMEENDLQADYLEEKTMLLIPVK